MWKLPGARSLEHGRCVASATAEDFSAGALGCRRHLRWACVGCSTSRRSLRLLAWSCFIAFRCVRKQLEVGMRPRERKPDVADDAWNAPCTVQGCKTEAARLWFNTAGCRGTQRRWTSQVQVRGSEARLQWWRSVGAWHRPICGCKLYPRASTSVL